MPRDPPRTTARFPFRDGYISAVSAWRRPTASGLAAAAGCQRLPWAPRTIRPNIEGGRMDPVVLGIVFGAVFAAFDVANIGRMHWPSHRERLEALTAAAIERFMIGLLIPTVDLGTPRWLTGVIIGTSLSLPTAILT